MRRLLSLTESAAIKTKVPAPKVKAKLIPGVRRQRKRRAKNLGPVKPTEIVYQLTTAVLGAEASRPGIEARPLRRIASVLLT